MTSIGSSGISIIFLSDITDVVQMNKNDVPIDFIIASASISS